MERVLGNKVNFSNLVIWPGLLEAWLVLTGVKYHGNLYILIPLNQRLALTRLRATGPCSLSILTSCQFTNDPNRKISRGVLQNRGVCGQAFPLLPSPSPFHFVLLPLQLSRNNSIRNTCYAG